MTIGITAAVTSASASNSAGDGFPCPNCGKAFAREDLLRRHLVREQRAAAIPRLPRQKSCNECSRSKARCDLEYPCSRCRKKNKRCVRPISTSPCLTVRLSADA